MAPQYYSQRQLAPYRGTMHVVETDQATAFTVDGVDWRVRLRNAQGLLWPAGSWIDVAALSPTPAADALRAALDARPPLPFRQSDRFELWLLEKASGLPLALLQTRRALPRDLAVVDATWRPFLLEDNDFHAHCLDAQAAADPTQASTVPHRDVLERQVNSAARPPAAAQWFERDEDGGGVGLHGQRIGFDMQGRRLLAGAFPELVIAEDWRRDIEADLAREYHEWNAALLLTHSNLSRAMRARLERAAANRPEQLLAVFRLIGEFVDRSAIDVALVQARIIAAAGVRLVSG